MDDLIVGFITKFIAFGLVTAVGWGLYYGVVRLLDMGTDKVEEIIKRKKEQ